MTLAPRVNIGRDHIARFQCFWSAPQGWGSFALTRLSLALTVAAGSIPLRELLIAPAFAAPAKLRVTSGSNAVTFAASTENIATLLRFPSEVSADKDHPLRVEA